MQHNYSYESALAASSRINWKVDDIIGGDKKLDFTKPFLPESLARVNELSFLSPAEKTTLNQIRGHEYLSMFGLVEEFILPYVVDHARPQISGDDYRVRALLGFAGDQAGGQEANRSNGAGVLLGVVSLEFITLYADCSKNSQKRGCTKNRNGAI